MIDLLARIQPSDLPPIFFLSKYKWNHLGNFPTSDFKVSGVEAINVEDKDDIPYIQHYLVVTSKKVGCNYSALSQHIHPRICPYIPYQGAYVTSLWVFPW